MNCNMKPKSLVNFVLGIALIIFGIALIIITVTFSGIIPLLIGCSLCYIGWSRSRIATLVFGHTVIVVGCFLITWGIYLLPYSKPILSHILGRPLFWGLFSLFGGICAIYHGFCQCIHRQKWFNRVWYRMKGSGITNLVPTMARVWYWTNIKMLICV